MRTNTSLLRRRVRTPDLRIRELLVGRQTVTPVDIVWIEGITNPETVRAVERRVAEIDIDALIATGNLEGIYRRRHPHRLSHPGVHRTAGPLFRRRGGGPRGTAHRRAAFGLAPARDPQPVF
ncbi:MAG: spore germination protein [Intestinimonas sp.]